MSEVTNGVEILDSHVKASESHDLIYVTLVHAHVKWCASRSPVTRSPSFPYQTAERTVREHKPIDHEQS